VQSRLIHDRVRNLAEEKKLPVLTFCEDLAASGGYMLALAGDEIYADVSSIVGSIGVVGATFGAHEAIAKLGVERRVYTAGKNKVRLDPFRPETEDDRAFVKRIQTAIHAGFIDLVKARRDGKLDAQAELFEGDVWTGGEAERLGLIDGIGHARAVLRAKFGDDVQIKDVPAGKVTILKRLLGGGADALLDAVEERVAYARYGL
jgi:serine protease SohB